MNFKKCGSNRPNDGREQPVNRPWVYEIRCHKGGENSPCESTQRSLSNKRSKPTKDSHRSGRTPPLTNEARVYAPRGSRQKGRSPYLERYSRRQFRLTVISGSGVLVMSNQPIALHLAGSIILGSPDTCVAK
jgi:hypothetical protein